MDEGQRAIAIEAIKTKNVIVLERYKNAVAICSELIDLCGQHQAALEELQFTRDTVKSAVGKLEREFHPKWYRSAGRVMSKFELVNDLFSGYHLALKGFINFKTMKPTLLASKSVFEVSRQYRWTWSMLSWVPPTLVRVSSNDLRFWLTDYPYGDVATAFATRDLAGFHRATQPAVNVVHRLSLETREGLDEFWNEVISQCGVEQNASSTKKRR